MKIIEKITDLQNEINNARVTGRSIGLVPTMGALHEGHLSLVEQAKTDKLFLIVTIFVNPTQFNDPKDLESYPRDINKDLGLLKNLDVDMVFTPDVDEMYPSPDNRIFDLDPLDKPMEGIFRPGHFNGVAQIVSKLFEIVDPDKAYFGQKDLQQLTIIKKIASSMNKDMEIIGCQIIREKDGLAMSSRNQLLDDEARQKAPFIYETLEEAKALRDNYTPLQIKDWVKEKFSRHESMKLEYFEIIEDQNLTSVKTWEDAHNIVGCIAVYLNGVRLIDNIYFT